MSEENVRGILNKLEEIQKDVTQIKINSAGHTERTNSLQNSDKLQWWVIGMILIGIIGLAFNNLSAR